MLKIITPWFPIVLFTTVISMPFQPLFSQAWPADTITININSGNPAFPFPQFWEYAAGKSLAANNPPGIVHAEMEQSIRDAYRIMMNRAIYSGEKHGSIHYIKFNAPVVPDNYGTFVSEGDGYALLAAAYMGDKNTFDGLWCWVHDNRLSKVKRYIDCKDLRPGYKYGGPLAGWQNDASTPDGQGSNDAAEDGDADIGLALLVAYKQWGDTMGINDACGNPISYKQEALNYINAMVAPVGVDDGDPSTPLQYVSGDIGIDGYFKNGNTWGEMTDWAITSPAAQYKPACGFVFSSCNQNTFFDYGASGYYKAFGDFLQAHSQPAFHIHQYKKAEASTDWLMGQLYAKGFLPFAGNVSVNATGSVVNFSNVGAGEDFRAPWRTILNYVWHGSPTGNWDPVNHAVIPGTNTWEKDNAIRLAAFLKKPNAYAGGTCIKLGSDPTDVKVDGPQTLVNYYSLNGIPNTNYYINWVPGTGSPAAVASGDVDLMAKLYRQLELEWDASNTEPKNEEERYTKSTPKYFHGWFRLMGMLTLTGNLHSPAMITAGANLKIYSASDKTFAFPADTITYTLHYRNYGSLPASGVIIRDTIPAGMAIADAAGGTLTGNVISWNIGSLPGLQNQNYSATKGTIVFKVIIQQSASGTLCNRATIYAANSASWTSNGYPNHITSTMERNCVDITTRGLQLTKTVNKYLANPGDSLAYTLHIKNSTDAGWLNGGRPGVRVTFANTSHTSSIFYLFFRILHGADEAYINYGNYRISYYINQPGISGVYPNSPTGWVLEKYLYEGGSFSNISFTTQNIPFGSDSSGSWNQRLIIKFADQLAAPVSHLYNYFGQGHRVHRGTLEPLKAWFSLKDYATNPINWTDDWSYNPVWNVGGNDKSTFFPVTPDWEDPSTPGTAVNNVHIDECRTAPYAVDKILVEEFDGYAWRRILGKGPIPGREQENVILKDTLPKEFVWGGFIKKPSTGTIIYDSITRVITWSVPAMLTGAKEIIQYYGYVKSASELGGCESLSRKSLVNTAWAWSSTESRIAAQTKTNLTCAIISLPPPLTSMRKETDKKSYKAGEEITYTLSYTNTHGAITHPVLDDTSGWISRNGGAANLPIVSGGKINLDWASSTYMITYNKSHGTNGTLTGTIEHINFQDLTVFARYNATSGLPSATNGVYVSFKAKSGGIDIYIYNGLTLLNSYSGPFSGSSSGSGPFIYNYKIELNDSSVKVYINDFNGPPLVSVTNAIVQAGYAGILNMNANGSMPNAKHKLYAWNTHLDSGFDLKMTDPIPQGLTFVSATNALYNNISTSYSGFNSSGIVEWTSIPGPVLAKDSIIYIWKAQINECSPFITNTAYMKMSGIVPDPGAQVIVACDNTMNVLVPGSQGNEITVYPNPFSEQIRINIKENNNKKAQLRIYSAMGEMVYASGISLSDEYLLLPAYLPAGIYLLQVIQENKIAAVQIVKN